eukprot:Skav224251  [mRNA]  locus=scaffold2636:4260:9680:+ [translate_table: standard]
MRLWCFNLLLVFVHLSRYSYIVSVPCEVVAKHVLVQAPVAGKEAHAVYEPGTHFGVLPDYEHKTPVGISVDLPLWPFAEDGPLSQKNAPPSCFPMMLEQAAQRVGKDIHCSWSQEVALAAEKPVPHVLRPGEAPSLPWEDLSKTFLTLSYLEWTKWTWKDYYDDSRRLAKAFIKLGVEQFGSVTIFVCYTSKAPEWALSAMGAMMCGGKFVGIYSTDTPEQVRLMMENCMLGCQARMFQVAVVDSHAEFAATVAHIEDIADLTCLNAIVCWGTFEPTVIKRPDAQSGMLMDAASPAWCVAAIGQAMRPGHAMGIIYTSGTTGQPKAVMIHHDAVVAQGAIGCLESTGILEGAGRDGS